jgi:thiamine-phosphate pyrophosphorylase
MSENEQGLPRLMVITQSDLMGANFDLALLSALRGGARWVQLREKELGGRQTLALAHRALKLCETYGARLAINSRIEVARASHADGVQLSETDLPPRDIRSILGHHARCGVSAHSVETARRAEQEGADYLVFGPVFPTPTHPGAPAQGLQVLAEAARAVRCPLLAVGGIGPEEARACREAGAHGVAVIRAAWQPEHGNIEKAVSELCEAVEQPRPTLSHLPAHLTKAG